MVAPGCALPVAPEQAQVEVPGGGRRRSAGDSLSGVVTEEDGREARRRAQTLLRGAEGEVHAGLLHGNFHTAQRRYGVHQEQSAVPVGEVGQLLQGLEDTGGGLGVHHCEHLDPVMAPQLRLHRIQVYGASPFLLHLGDGRPVAPCDVREPLAEEAVGSRNDHVAGLEQVRDTSLHTGVAGTGRGGT